jgi:hypothetical protein
MSPIVSTLAGASARGYGGLGAQVTDSGNYESIATVNVGSATSTITFSSIPSTFTHLQLRIIARTSIASVQDDLLMRFNGDSANNYGGHQFFGNSSTVGSNTLGGTLPVNILYPGYISGNSAGSNTYGIAIIDIFDYTNGNKKKTWRSLNGNENNESGFTLLRSGFWNSTSTISSIVFFLGGANYMQHSSFALYGIKGAA